MWQWLSTPPGRTSLPAGVDLLRAARQLLGQRDDAAVPHADVGAERIGGGHHGAVANDQIERLHGRTIS